MAAATARGRRRGQRSATMSSASGATWHCYTNLRVTRSLLQVESRVAGGRTGARGRPRHGSALGQLPPVALALCLHRRSRAYFVSFS